MDRDRLKQTWKMAQAYGSDFVSTFYAHLFVNHPELRELFPVAMNAQQDRFLQALGRIVSSDSDSSEFTEYVSQLGRDHRRFDVSAEQYDVVGSSLLWTLKHFLQDEWTPDTARAWTTAYNRAATTMIAAAEKSEDEQPPWWTGEVVEVQRVSREIATFTVQLDQVMDYSPGQSISVSGPHATRVWRHLTPANAPRNDKMLDFHVAMVPGGQFSVPFVKKTSVGDVLKLGSPIGTDFRVDPDQGQDLLLVAGSTGIAPLLAIMDEITSAWDTGGTYRRVHLVHGVRYSWNLYATERLQALAQYPQFSFDEVVSDDASFPGKVGLVGDVAASAVMPSDYSAVVCGSPRMVEYTAHSLRARNVPPTNILIEEYDLSFETDL